MLYKFCLLRHKNSTRGYFSGGIGDEWKSCDFARTMSLQIMVMEILRNYWVPKYVIALSKTSVDQPNLFSSEAEERKEKERQVKSMQKSLASKKLRV